MESRITPNFNNTHIAIVSAFDDNYALCGAALISSIIRNSTPSNNYDIVIMSDNVTQENQNKLLSLNTQSNISIRFVDVNQLKEIQSAFSYSHFTKAAYARLYIPQLFHAYDKAIYIDPDSVVCTDIAELYNTNLSQNLIGAVRDFVMDGYVRHNALSPPETGSLPAKEYLLKMLNLDSAKNYFLSGLLIFNIKQILQEKIDKALVESIDGIPLWFPDQDILNKVFSGRVHFIPMEWSVLHGNGDTNGLCRTMLPEVLNEYLKARANPKVIQYGGEQKPWINKNIDFYEEFYQNIKDTAWEKDLHLRLKNANLVKKIKGQLSPFVSKFFPLGSKRRNLVKNFYHKINSFLEK